MKKKENKQERNRQMREKGVRSHPKLIGALQLGPYSRITERQRAES